MIIQLKRGIPTLDDMSLKHAVMPIAWCAVRFEDGAKCMMAISSDSHAAREAFEAMWVGVLVRMEYAAVFQVLSLGGCSRIVGFEWELSVEEVARLHRWGH